MFAFILFYNLYNEQEDDSVADEKKYKRIVLKLSGEALAGEKGFGIDPNVVNSIARQIKEVLDCGLEIAVVNGGGNIWRGLSGANKGMDRATADYMGMLATVINGLGLSSALTSIDCPNKVLTAIRMEPIGELYSKWKAIDAMEQGQVAILVGGTGNPYFTTDTGSSLRGIEIEADVMLKGTRVDGVYTADPEKDPTATTMCKENGLSIYVFNMDVPGNLKKVIAGEPIGTLVHK